MEIIHTLGKYQTNHGQVYDVLLKNIDFPGVKICIRNWMYVVSIFMVFH